MACDAQTILDDSACLYAMPSFLLAVVQMGAWCGVNANVTPGGGVEGAIANPEGGTLWNPEAPGVIVNPEA
jgi:hypothetical protein